LLSDNDGNVPHYEKTVSSLNLVNRQGCAMSISERVSLFVLLNAFYRFGCILKEMGVDMPKEVALFMDELWACLVSGSSKLNTASIDSVIDSTVVEEQNADYIEVLRNFYFYALSDLIVFFAEGAPDGLSAAESSIIDAYDYMAGQRYIVEKKAGKAVVLTDEEEAEILTDPMFVGETNSLQSDRAFAEKIVDWQHALKFR
jgi:hypothetical protein